MNPETLSRREIFGKVATAFSLPFASAMLEVHAKADDILSGARPVEEAKHPVISVVMDGAISQTDSFDAKEHPKENYTSGIGTYSPKGAGDTVFSELFPNMGRHARDVAICRTVRTDDARTCHLDQTKMFLLDGEGRNWHQILADAAMQKSGHPHYYIPDEHYDIGLKTNTQGAGLRRENHPPHRLEKSYNFSEQSEQLFGNINRERLQRRVDLQNLLPQDHIPDQVIQDYLETRKLAYGLLLNDARKMINAPDPKTKDRYGEYGMPFYYAGKLVERGAKSVTIRVGSWDFHSGYLASMNEYAPKFDAALAALLDDIKSEALPPAVVSVAGEFGRSPRFEDARDGGGRDHGKIQTALLYGGKTKPGRYGRTDDRGEPRDDSHVIDIADWKYVVFAAAEHQYLVPETVHVPNWILQS